MPASQRKKARTHQPSQEFERRPSSSMSQSSFLSQLSQRKSPSLPGVIKSLRLQNFMCHSNFTHNFHMNLNFITGQNGSGKSALLSGILVALGGKAAVTSRTTSLKSLIQKGKHTCRVAVTLHNENGLRRYGDEITIERWVNMSGSGGYRIKTDGGDGECNTQGWRQLKRNELDSILRGLNIQIDNPVAILNQEVARSFLRSKDPKVKFKLFYNGTLLSKLESTLEDTERELDETKNILCNQKRVIMDIKKEVVRLQTKCQKIAELQQIKATLDNINGDYLWSLVIEKETAAQATSQKISKVEKEIDILRQKLHEQEQSYEGLNEESIIREQDEVREQLAVKKGKLSTTRGELNELKRNLTNIRMKLKTVTSTIASKEAQIQKLSSQVERLKSEQDKRAEEETNKEEERRNELEAQKKNLESIASSIKADAENFQISADQERDKLQKLEENARNLKGQIEAKKRNIVALNNKGSKYSMFGQKMELLMDKIKANMRRFRKPPRGPLGACFTVKDPSYVVLIESVLKQSLDSFVVDNSKDFLLLKQLIDSVYKDRTSRQSGPGGYQKTPGIITCAFAEQMHDISRLKASHSRVPTIFDLLAVENNDHIVYNALIDCCEVERMLLFKRNEDASAVLKSESTCPRTLKNAFTLQWYKFTPAPHYAARVMPIKQRAEILRSGRGRETEIEALQLEIKTLENEILGLDPHRVEIRAQERSLRSAYESKSNEHISVRKQLGEVTIQIKRHNDKMMIRQKQCDLSSYYEELDELRTEVDSQIVVRNELTTEFEAYRPQLTELDDSKKLLDKECEDLTTSLNGLEETRDQLASRRLVVDNVIKKLRARIANLKADKLACQTELESLTAAVEEKTKNALETCPVRRNTKRTPNDLRKEFDAVKIRIREAESQLGDVEKLKKALSSEREKYKTYMKSYTPLNSMYSLLRQTANSQQESFETTKTHMCRTLQIFFSSMAKTRGYEGRLHVDPTTQELYYFVCPDGDSNSKTLKAIDKQQAPDFEARSPEQIRESKKLKKALVEYSLGLSGGERSFATICFIMALWQVMECPFYMLDEFDVFMDAFNRKTSQTALIAHAKKFSTNQYVLFTPLDITDLPDSNEACVLRLYPPIRGTDGAEASASQSTGKGGSHGSSSNESRTNGQSTRKGNNTGSPTDGVENIDPEAGVSRHRKRPGDSVRPQRNKQPKLQALFREC